MYDIFDSCKRFTLDPYWRDRLRECSTGKFPRGMSFDASTNIVRIRIGDIRKKIKLGTDPKRNITILLTIFSKYLGLVSNRDLELDREKMHKLKEEKISFIHCEWKQIRPRYVREQLLCDYVSKLAEKYKLSESATRKLSALISIAFEFKAITTNDIEYSNGKITKINNLRFDKKNKRFLVPEFKCVARNEKTATTDRFHTIFDKYHTRNETRLKRLVI